MTGRTGTRIVKRGLALAMLGASAALLTLPPAAGATTTAYTHHSSPQPPDSGAIQVVSARQEIGHWDGKIRSYDCPSNRPFLYGHWDSGWWDGLTKNRSSRGVAIYGFGGTDPFHGKLDVTWYNWAVSGKQYTQIEYWCTNNWRP